MNTSLEPLLDKVPYGVRLIGLPCETKSLIVKDVEEYLPVT